MSGPYYAHTPPDDDPSQWQSMREHATNVADLAATFAQPFGASDLARWAAWLHDVGKYSDEFQKYLRDCHASIPANSVDHKTAGAKVALTMPPGISDILGAAIVGHHGGMIESVKIKSRIQEIGRIQNLDAVIERARQDLAQLASIPPTSESIGPFLGNANEGDEQALRFEMLTRFLFSCLVDADSLDTEAHFDKGLAAARDDGLIAPHLDRWIATLSESQAGLQEQNGEGAVNRVRREVYEACLGLASSKPGLFTLTVPTGGGKTRSSLAFALQHARCNEMRRIIYSIPYTSIIDQTVAVFRNILGDAAVLEHHSAVDPRTDKPLSPDGGELSEEVRRRLASENWSAPLIVTTNVQLFESLFSNRTSKCRKLHNIAGSVIILDEVQTLPLNLLTPLLDGLRSLIHQFGCTIVLCTATQPAITEDTPVTKGIGTPTPIVGDPAPHFEILKRVQYVIEDEPLSWEQVAERMRSRKRSCLTVVNTKKDAVALIGELGVDDDDVYHLSTLLCGAHRRSKLDEIKARLVAEREGKGSPIYLASTQLIEAGVDVDFPRVMRAMGPLDRIIQAAGRCNREGLRDPEESEVLVFEPVDGRAPLGEYRTAMEEARRLIKESQGSLDFDSPEIATEYFAKLYGTLQAGYLDEKRVQDSRMSRDFPSVASKVRLIKDDTIPVLVDYKPKEAIYNRVLREIEWRQSAKKPLTRALWRSMQPITVAVYADEAARSQMNFDVLVPDQLLAWKLPYDEVFGIGGSLVYRDPSDLFT